MSPWEGEVGPPFPTRSRGEPLGGISCHDPLWERWPAAGGTHGSGARAVPKGGEAQAIKIIGDELKAPKANGYAEGKSITRQALATSVGSRISTRGG
jgi:hypothetical protein